MDILEGAMAFAVAMILFSTIITGIVEAILRVSAVKARFLAEAVDRLIDDLRSGERAADLQVPVLPPPTVLAARHRRGGAGARERLVTVLTENPLWTDAHRRPSWWERELPRWMPVRLRDWWTGHRARLWLDRWALDRCRVEGLSTYGFAMRLARSSYGPEITAHGLGQGNADVLWTEILLSFERFRALLNERFRLYAQRLSLILAVVLAIGFNIDAGRLIEHLINDREARQRLLTAAPQVVEHYQAELAEAEARRDQLEHQAAPRPDEKAKLQEEIARQIAGINAALAPMATEGTLPIGFDYFPYGCKGSRAPEAGGTARVTGTCEDGRYAIWLFNTVIAGLLIGLGGPFWYRVFSSLSQLALALRAVGGAKPGAEMQSNDNAAPLADHPAQAAAGEAGIPDVVVAVLKMTGGLPQVVDLPGPEDGPAPQAAS